MRTKPRKFAGIIALLVLITFNFTACKDSDDDEDSDGSGVITAFGENLELSGQVYTGNWNSNNTMLNYVNFTENLEIDDSMGGSGIVTGGILNYTVGKPNGLYSINKLLEDLFGQDDYKDLLASSSDAQGYYKWYLSTPNGGLYRENIIVNVYSSSFSYTDNTVIYVYVDKDVTVSGTGKTETSNTYTSKETYTTNSFNLALKAGWNTIKWQWSHGGTFTGSYDSPTSLSSTKTKSYTLDNPSSLRWVYYNGGGSSNSVSLKRR